MVEYVLERFLYRLAASPLGRDHFVLKGGLLLAQFGARRMTRDIDILGRVFPGDAPEIIRRIASIAATDIDDGVTFDALRRTSGDRSRVRFPPRHNGLLFTLRTRNRLTG